MVDSTSFDYALSEVLEERDYAISEKVFKTSHRRARIDSPSTQRPMEVRCKQSKERTASFCLKFDAYLTRRKVPVSLGMSTSAGLLVSVMAVMQYCNWIVDA